MSLIQEEFNKSSGDFLLSPGEYEGPLLIADQLSLSIHHRLH